MSAILRFSVGYSDITTLLTYFADAAGFVTFHGPMLTKDFALEDGVDLASWNAALGGQSEWPIDMGPESGVKPLAEGSAEGILYGGCLSILAASLGTPYEIQTEGTILFLEDIATKPFQIDRMLMQLKLANKLSGVRGLVFGEMLDCVQHPQDQGYTLEEVILRVVGDLNVPVAYGLRSGHVSRQQYYFAHWSASRFDLSGGQVSLNILEAATTCRFLQAQESRMSEKKHIHLIGICGTAMAVAGRHAAGARLSRHRLGCGGLSADVRIFWHPSAFRSHNRLRKATSSRGPI